MNLVTCNGYGKLNIFPGIKCFVISVILALSTVSISYGVCVVDISDEPMETKAQAAPSNVMFVLDNSGSMDGEFMTSQNDGKYNGETYLYPDSAFINSHDRDYYSSTSILDTEKQEWKSQWAGYNKIFYNPNALYSPWPNMSNADTDTPFSDPYKNNSGDSKFNMDGVYYTVLSSTTTEVIIDNLDAEFFMNTPGAWSTGKDNGYPYHLDDYYFTSSSNDAVDDWVTWTPVLPVAGNYDVAVWWTSNGSRDATVFYDIFHNGATDTAGPYDQQANDGAWNDIGNYNFSAGGSEFVKLTPDTAGQSLYSADAVRFRLTDGSGAISINVTNAHYFVINDIDEDGEKDAGEDIYLVNFVDQDGDGSLDDREYYLFNDDGDDTVEDGELEFKSESIVPDRVRAGQYDEDGNFVGFATDAEDLQNWANWFSYYRKRDHTAKAAVAGAIVKLEWVYVGFYSINSGLRQSVLPIKVESNEIIVDNQDSGYQESGSWYESSASNEYDGSSRYTRGSGNYATWRPDIPSAGNYKVYVWYDYSSRRDTNALYTVHHSTGDFTVRLNQKVDYSQWVELGSFDFAAGTGGYVRVKRDGSSTGTSTSADAVRFESTGGGGVEVDETDTLLSKLYAMSPNGNTPLRKALQNVGRYYDADDGDDGNLGPSPFASELDGGSCQQAFTIVITDGFWNGDSPSVGNQDSNTASNYDGAPYADSYSNTLADVAMKYYKEDLVNSVDDMVPTNSCDPANHQHMVTYGVSFGVTGTLNPDDYHSCLLEGTTPTWPNPTAGDSQKIDDLYHASVNGRGLFFSAANPQELVSSLESVTSNIASRMSSGSSVSVNGDELNTGTILYQASYVSDSWTGDVTAYPVDPTTGEIKKEESDIIWHASDQLQAILWSDRNIVTYDPVANGGIEFSYTALTAAQQVLLNSDPNVVDYIKGNEITGFRSRTRKLGDIVHSAPLLMGNTIYAGGNDGMLHAFNAETGDERFAFVPNLIMDNFYDETEPEKSFFEPGYEHLFFVDLTPFAAPYVDIDGDFTDDRSTLLVGGLGKGGKGYYCLDITDADTKTIYSSIDDVKNMVRWEYPTSADADMGYSYSSPIVVRSNATASESILKKKWGVIFGNGYGADNGNAVLYILNADGSLLKKIDTGVGGCNGLSTPSVVDVDFNLTADYVYAGDLKGNLWKFDIRDADPSNWEVAYKDSSGNPAPLFSVPGKPITSKPDVMSHCQSGYENLDLTCEADDRLTGYMVLFGTGKFLNEDDRASTESQYVFGIWDYGDDADNAEYIGEFNEGGSPQLSNMDADIKLLEQTEIYNGYHGGYYLRVLSQNSPDWTIKCDSTGGQDPDPDPVNKANVGWYFKLPIAGERIIKDVIVRDRKLIYISFTPDASPCSGGGSSIIHEVDACSGGRLDYAQFDIDDDRDISSSDTIDIGLVDGSGNPILVAPSGTRRSGMLHLPVFIRFPNKPVEMKIFSSSAGSTESVFENQEPRGLFYWRSNQ